MSPHITLHNYSFQNVKKVLKSCITGEIFIGDIIKYVFGY